MFLHFLHLLVGEPAGLIDYCGIDAYFAEIVQEESGPSSCILCELDF